MKKYIFPILLTLSAVSTHALDVTNVTPGTLQQRVGTATDATTLTVTGAIDVRDLDFIADKMKSVTTLDLSGTSVAAYKGLRKLTLREQFSANALPAMSLAASTAKTVKLPAGITAIEDGAFAGANVAEIEIPASVTTIGHGAFADCNNMVRITIPATVTTVGEGVLQGCAKLFEVTWGAANIPDNAMRQCPELTKVTVTGTPAAIGAKAFADNPKLWGVVSTNEWQGLTTIGNEAFRNTDIRVLDFAKATKLTTVGAWAFADNPAMGWVMLPASVTSLGEGVMFDATALQSYDIPTSVTVIPPYAMTNASTFNSTRVMGPAVTEIGKYAFHNMDALQEITLPGTLELIGDYAMSNMTALQRIEANALYHVPSLGSEVWHGVDQPNVFLGVPQEMIPQFEAAEQWQNFNMVVSGIQTVIDPDTSAKTALRTLFAGTELTVEATTPIDSIEIYDTMGSLLHSAPLNGATRYSYDTSRWAARIYIIRVATLGTTLTAKAAR